MILGTEDGAVLYGWEQEANPGVGSPGWTSGEAHLPCREFAVSLNWVQLSPSTPGAVRIDLPPASHRDPSDVLPAAAEAARSRQFDDDSIRTAVVGGRFYLTRSAPERVTRRRCGSLAMRSVRGIA